MRLLILGVLFISIQAHGGHYEFSECRFSDIVSNWRCWPQIEGNAEVIRIPLATSDEKSYYQAILSKTSDFSWEVVHSKPVLAKLDGIIFPQMNASMLCDSMGLLHIPYAVMESENIKQNIILRQHPDNPRIFILPVGIDMDHVRKCLQDLK